MANIYYKYGAMNSGKTTNILQTAYNYEERDQKVILIKPLIDKKGGDQLVSRLGVTRKVDYLIDSDESIIVKINSVLDKIDCILVDEVQFITLEQAYELLIIAKKYNITVIAYGLKTDFLINEFPGSLGMFRYADIMEEMETICRCGNIAKFNARIVNGEFVKVGDQVAIDEMNNVSYESLCGECYLEKVEKIKILENNKSIKRRR